MDKKKKFIVSSTPHVHRTQQVMSLFDDIQCSPIIGPTQVDGLGNPKVVLPTLASNEQTQTGPGRKRKVTRKAKAAPESATAEVFKELGVGTQDIVDNGFSHSRNLYNMFPEPIILDSDEENSLTASKKPVKKLKQDSKVGKSITNENPEKKTAVKRVPGSSRTIRSVVDTKRKKISSIPTTTCNLGGSKNLSQFPRTKIQTKNKDISESVVILENDDSFPEYQPGITMVKAVNKTKKIENVRVSLELDEKFPIEWSTRPKRTVGIKAEKSSDVDNGEVRGSKSREANVDKKTITGADRRNKNKVTHVDLSKEEGPKHKSENVRAARKKNENIDKHDNGNCVKTRNKNMKVPSGKEQKLKNLDKAKEKEKEKSLDSSGEEEEEDLALISRFKDVIFKQRSSDSGIVARCLATDSNDIGYLEVPAKKTFSGDRKNITFVVIEGEAKVTYLGRQRHLVAGDMIHLTDDAGYTLDCVGTSHVRFLYIKEH